MPSTPTNRAAAEGSAPAPPAASRDLKRIRRYLARIGKVFDLDQVLALPGDPAAIVDYYAHSRELYRRQSPEGAIHMALNFEGRHGHEDYYGQARLVEKQLAACSARRVLELGCGAGFNSVYLAREHPEVQFCGLDLSAAHIAEATARARDLPNLKFVAGDFHALPWPDASLDLVFEVEAVCHVRDLARMASEAFRVLRPRGRFLLFDGCRRSEFYALPPEVQTAARLVEQAMAVRTELVIDDVARTVEQVGFRILERTDITAAAIWNINQLQRLAKVFFLWPWLARRMHRQDPSLVNAIAMLLAPETIRAGAHGYFHAVIEKP